jgi:hypothetical protein
MNRELIKDIAVRASKTFVQAFVAVWLVVDEPFSKTALIAGLSAGVSAVWNTIFLTKKS